MQTIIFHRREHRLAMKCLNTWRQMFNEELVHSNFTCPDFEDYMDSCIQELLSITDVCTVFNLIQSIFKTHGIKDTIGASYWYLQAPFSKLKVSAIPKQIRTHPWIFTHYLYLSQNKMRLRLKYEREHVHEFSKWIELTHIRSEVRRQIRRIDVQYDRLKKTT